MALLLVVLRRVNNKGESELSKVYLTQHMQGLEKTLFIMPKQAEYDEEVAKYFLLTEEIVLSVKTLGVFDKDP